MQANINVALSGYSSGLLSNDHSAYWVLNEAERAINAKKVKKIFIQFFVKLQKNYMFRLQRSGRMDTKRQRETQL